MEAGLQLRASSLTLAHSDLPQITAADSTYSKTLKETNILGPQF